MTGPSRKREDLEDFLEFMEFKRKKEGTNDDEMLMITSFPEQISIPVNSRLLLFDIGAAEETRSVVTGFESGYSNVTQVGVSVVQDIYAEINFTITMRATTAQQVQDSSSSLREAMNTSEKSEYDRTVQSYSGGFSIPCLSWFGVRADASYSREQINQSRQQHRDYDRQATVQSNNLQSLTESRIEVTGKILASGSSRIPSVGFAFIKIVSLKLNNGSTLNIVSTKEPPVAADSNGNVLPATQPSISIRPGVPA